MRSDVCREAHSSKLQLAVGNRIFSLHIVFRAYSIDLAPVSS